MSQRLRRCFAPDAASGAASIRGMNRTVMIALTRAQVPWFRICRGRFQGPPTLLMTAPGRRSGKPRTVALLYYRDGDDLIVIGSNGGGAADPFWVANAVEAGEVEVQRSGEWGRKHRAALIEEEERYGRVWAEITAKNGHYEGYRKMSGHKIPLLALTPA